MDSLADSSIEGRLSLWGLACRDDFSIAGEKLWSIQDMLERLEHDIRRKALSVEGLKEPHSKFLHQLTHRVSVETEFMMQSIDDYIIISEAEGQGLVTDKHIEVAWQPNSMPDFCHGSL